MTTSNGRAPLTKEALADTTRFQFKKETIELPEIGGSITLKALSVGERDSLPELTDKNGNPDISISKLAAIFAAAVDEPKVTREEAEEFLTAWPATALDTVIEKFGELAGGEKEQSAAAGAFPADE